MEHLRRVGIEFILWLQQLPIFGEREQMIWLFITKLGDPALNFSLYFPLFYPFLPAAMIDFVAVGTISEFLNGIFKWMMLDERPYWWFYTSGIHEQFEKPLKQFKWTCETGPGSPSGHAMVSSSVWLAFLGYFQKSHVPRGLRPLVWLIYIFYLLALCLSRTYIGAHFPDQVALGTLCGVVLTLSIGKWTSQRHSLVSWFAVLSALTLLSVVTYAVIVLLGRDPDWSIALAKQYCERTDWVHISTTPLASYFRDGGAILAVAAYDHVNADRLCAEREMQSRTFMQRILSSILGLSMVNAVRAIPIAQLLSTNCYYVILAAVHLFTMLLVGIGLPSIVRRFGKWKNV